MPSKVKRVKERQAKRRTVYETVIRHEHGEHYALVNGKKRDFGCSLFPEGNWHECCVAHDYAYCEGGTRQDRKKADIQLMRCVALKGHPHIAYLMFLGVRLFGGPFFPTRFRWGFGRPYLHFYKPKMPWER